MLKITTVSSEMAHSVTVTNKLLRQVAKAPCSTLGRTGIPYLALVVLAAPFPACHSASLCRPIPSANMNTTFFFFFFQIWMLDRAFTIVFNV